MVMAPSTAQLPHSGASGSKMTPIQAREELQRRGLPLTAENLNRMMATSYGMDVPDPDNAGIDTSIADTEEQKASMPTPPLPPRRGEQVVSGNPMPEAPPAVQPPAVNAAVPAPPTSVDNISPDDPADTGARNSGRNGLSITSAPANTSGPVTNSSPVVGTGDVGAGSFMLGEPSSMPSPVEALIGAGSEVGNRLFNEGATIPRGAVANPVLPTASPLLMMLMQMLQGRQEPAAQSPAMGGPPRRN